MRSKVKNPPDQTNEEEKEFRAMTVKMIQNLGNRMEKIQETYNNEEIKKYLETNNNGHQNL